MSGIALTASARVPAAVLRRGCRWRSPTVTAVPHRPGQSVASRLNVTANAAAEPDAQGSGASPVAQPEGQEAAFLSTTLTEEELAELQMHLELSSGGKGRRSHTALSAQRNEDDDPPAQDAQADNPPSTGRPEEDGRERVFLVGVEVRGGREQSANTSLARRVAAAAASNLAAAAARQQGGGPGPDSSASSPSLPGPRGASGNGRNKARGRSAAAAHMYTVHESLEELARLADTARLQVVGATHQSIEIPNNATYIGSGKVAEVARAVRALNAQTVIFDCELSPGQLRNLEKALGGEQGPDAPRVQVADRTALILDIFSQRAATREGKLQVELAQVEYQLPRLTRMWTHLDRVGGGGQVKGAGEKQIEMDKRLLRERAAALRRELEAVRGHRRAYRQRRAVAPIPVVALVGYTNAGKSTLLNRLTNAGVLAEDKLFATLDPTTRKLRLKPGNREVLLSDTVGFIQALPTELVAAFRATLEEVQDANVLVHLVDISHPNAAAQYDAVLQVLDDLGVSHIPLVTVWNKLDACPDSEQVRKVAARRRDTVCLSGRTGEGLEGLTALIVEKLSATMTEVEVCLPYTVGDMLDDIHRAGELVVPPEYTENGVLVTARVPQSLAGRLQPYSLRPLEERRGPAGSASDPSPADVVELGGDLLGWDRDVSDWAKFPVTLPTAPATSAA